MYSPKWSEMLLSILNHPLEHSFLLSTIAKARELQSGLPMRVLAFLTRIRRMWTAPSSQGVLQCFDQIACVHMSGLFVRSHMNAGQDGFRDESSKQMSDLIEGHWECGMSLIVDRLITPSAHHLASSGIGSARLQLSCSPCLADL